MTAVTYPKTAACGCGALTAMVSAPPRGGVHACSCTDCQRGTGSAFSYSAFFADSDVAISGERKTWRRSSASGRWLESIFCPTCGVTVAARLEVVPGQVAISVGCFADPSFAPPENLFWSSRRHQWLELPDGIRRVETQ